MHTARFAPGVIGQIMDGERRARVPDNVIDELKGREHNGIIALPKKPQLDPQAWLSVPPQSSDLSGSAAIASRRSRPYCPAAVGLPVPNTMTFAPIGVRL